MKKNELKQTLKPLIKECIKECIFEEGVLSGIITEVLAGMQTQRVVTEGITVKSETDGAERQQKIRALEEKAEAERQERIRKLPLSGQNPGDPGVNIDGILNLASGKWKHLI